MDTTPTRREITEAAKSDPVLAKALESLRYAEANSEAEEDGWGE